jgi:hypothetical protein
MAQLDSHHIQIHAQVEVNQLIKLAPSAPARAGPRRPLPMAEHLLKPACGI